jgi:hypothetical protein
VWSNPLGRSTRGGAMWDVVAVGLIALFFLLSFALAAGFERLR